MDLDAVRTFVAAADAGRFQDAAAELSITQQAVSKRLARLERTLGVRLFTRTPRGALLTVDGQAFLPHARDLLRSEERALASVRPGHRPLRVDVIGRRLAPAARMSDFHRAHPEVPLDVVTLFDADAAVDAILSGTVDASFRAVTMPGRRLPDGIAAARAFDEPIQLLTGPAHPFAASGTVTAAELAGHRIWMPGIVPGTEWAAYYDALAAAFGLTIEITGPDFGTEPVLDTIAGSRTLATFVGERTHLVWPAEHGLRRIAVRDPEPVYPHSLLWRRDNPHPALAALRDHLSAGAEARSGGTRSASDHSSPNHSSPDRLPSWRSDRPAAGTWTPAWARARAARLRPVSE